MAFQRYSDDDVTPARRASGARSLNVAALYATHAPDIRRLCLRLTRDPSAAEDLAQETFTRFIARLPSLAPDVNVGAYLQITARNLYLKNIRDDAHEFADDLLETRLGSDDDLERDPARATLLVEQIHQVRRSTARLNGRQRRALVLREVDGRSYPEIAEAMGISPDALAQVLARARTRLRSEYRREQGPDAAVGTPCDSIRNLLSSYLDGHVTPAVKVDVAAHLAGCFDCRDVLATYREAGIQLRAAGPLSPLAALLERAVAIVQGAVAHTTGTAAAVAGSAAIVVAGGGGLVVAHHVAPRPHDAAAAAASTSSVAASATTGAGGRLVRDGASGAATPTGETTLTPGQVTDPSSTQTTSGPGETTTTSAGTGGPTETTATSPPDNTDVDLTVSVPPLDTATPAATTPAITGPGITTPSVTTPPIATPPITTPAVTVPSVDVQQVTVPPVTIPPVTVPTVTIAPVKLPKLPGH
jgi:RNA polymerase sigma factor (sigma-70 family)